MRIKLQKGRQKELIKKAKKGSSWRNLSEKLNISKDYLRIDLYNERRLLSEKIFSRLCKVTDKDFSQYIQNKLDDNWGKSKGGINSRGSTIKLEVCENKKALAELIGIILGDGNITFYKKGKKVGVYQIKIAGDCKKDKQYHLSYIKPLCESLFNLKVKEIINHKSNERFSVISSKELVNFFIKQGLSSGDKIKNHVTIPNWILKDKELLKVCIRGLIDTDGSIFRMSNRNPNLLRINFTNYNIKLLIDVKKSLEKLGFFISKIINNRTIFISRKNDVERYLNEIGFSNQKHIKRLQKFKNSPVV